MSEHEPSVVIASEMPSPILGSLEARVAARRNELEKRTTEKFDVPGFEGVFQVELRVVGGKRQFKAYQSHERIHDEYQQGLRTAADLILMATIGFHSVVDVEGNTVPAEGASWKRFAKAFDKTLTDETLEQKGGGRVALVRLLGEEGVTTLSYEYKQWLRTRGVEVERDLEDFS